MRFQRYNNIDFFFVYKLTKPDYLGSRLEVDGCVSQKTKNDFACQ